ncbi:MAG: CoA pyrophosphatase [Pseudomonadota bacterium]
MAWRDLDDFLERAEQRLDPIEGNRRLREGGDGDFLTTELKNNIRPAAVLIGVIPRAEGPTALLTQRPDTMQAHAGQVAFPGGKIDPGDATPVAAALREAEEEVGVDPARVTLVAQSSDYLTGTGFRITPVVGVLPADFQPIPDATEVAAVFETPLSFLMDPANHQTGKAFYRGKLRRYYEMPHGGFRIWGVTAGIIKTLYDTLYLPRD